MSDFFDRAQKALENYKSDGDNGKLCAILSGEKVDFDEDWKRFYYSVADAASKREDKTLLSAVKVRYFSYFDGASANYDHELNIDEYYNFCFTYSRLIGDTEWKRFLSNATKVEQQIERTNTFFRRMDEVLQREGESAGAAVAGAIRSFFNAVCELDSEIGDHFLKELLKDATIAHNSLTPRFFATRSGKKLYDAFREYAKSNSITDIEWENQPVTDSYQRAMDEQRQKTRKLCNKLLIAMAVLLVVAIAAVSGVLIWGNTIDETTIALQSEALFVEYGDDIDLSPLKLTYTRHNGKTGSEQVTMDMIENFIPTQLGEQRITVRFRSATFTVSLTVSAKMLEAPLPEKDGNAIVWAPVTGAENYYVYVASEKDDRGEQVGTAHDCSFEMSEVNRSGEFFVYIIASNPSELYRDSQPSPYFAVSKSGVPTNVHYENGQIVWDAPANVSRYVVEINGVPMQAVNTPGYSFSFPVGVNSVRVFSYPAKSGAFYSVSRSINFEKLSAAKGYSFTNDLLSWDPVSPAAVYDIYRDGTLVAEASRSTSLDTSEWALGRYQISIIARSDSALSIASDVSSFSLVAGAKYAMSQGGKLDWTAINGCRYNVYLDGTLIAEQLNNNSFDLPAQMDAGKHTVAVSVCDTTGGEAFMCSLPVTKLPVPTLTRLGDKLVPDNGANVNMYLNGEPFDGDLSTIKTAGRYSVTAQATGNDETFTLASDESQPLTFEKLVPPTLSVHDGELIASASVRWFADGDVLPVGADVNESLLPGDHTVTAIVEANGDAQLSSEQSLPIKVFKLSPPTVTYDNKELSVTGRTEHFSYYLDGKQFNGDDISSLSPDIYTVTAKNLAGPNAQPKDDVWTLNSAQSEAVVIFYTDVQISVNYAANNKDEVVVILQTEMTNLVYDMDVTFEKDGRQIDTYSVKKRNAQSGQIQRFSLIRSGERADSITVTFKLYRADHPDEYETLVSTFRSN